MRSKIVSDGPPFLSGIVCAAVIIVFALGCNGGKSRVSLEMAVENYSHAILSGDGKGAFELLTDRCKRRLGPDVIEGSADLLSVRYRDEKPVNIIMEDKDGKWFGPSLPEEGRVYVTYSYPDQPDINQSREAWMWEQHGWRNDDC